MGELAPWHLIILVVIILLLFGAKRIPELARSVGSGMREFKDGVTGAPGKEPDGKATEPTLPPVPESTDASTAAAPDTAASSPLD